MSYKIEDIEGIAESYGNKLREAGVKTTDDLLEKAGAKKGRGALAEATGITEKLILKWANHADLMRISGVAGEYAELLEAAGVDTVKELRTRNAENLATKMDEVNATKKLTRQVPSAGSLQKWIDQAKDLEPRISH